MENYDKEKQFKLSKDEYLKKLDILNWHRFFAIIKAAEVSHEHKVLEVGPGEGTLKNVLAPFVARYETLDINQNLEPNYVGDIRATKQDIKGKYDRVIAADILEHIPFKDLGIALKNLNMYLKADGQALITIPHRSHYLLWITSLNHTPSILRIPTLKRLLGRKVWIDPDHEWEIGDGHHTIKDVEEIMRQAGFIIEKRKKLPYVDFWTLKK